MKKSRDQKGSAKRSTVAVSKTQRSNVNNAARSNVNVSSSLEIISLRDARKVLMKDVQYFTGTTDTSKIDSFINENLLNYYVCINTWLLMIEPYSPNCAIALQSRIEQRGLVDTIKFSTACSDKIINDGLETEFDQDVFGIMRWLLQDVADLALILQLLRYPKKLSLKDASAIADTSMEKFLEINKRCKVLNSIEFPYWLVSALRKQIGKMLRWYRLDDTLGYFSTGAIADGQKSLASKLSLYAKSYPFIFDQSCVLPMPSDFSEIPRFYHSMRRRTAVRVKAVPKSYKAARIIAEEPAANQFRMLAIAQSLRLAMQKSGYSKYCDTRDQGPNRELCRLASISGHYATIDKSSASDSIADSLVSSIFPTEVVRQFEECRSIYCDCGSKGRRIMQMFATSGSGLTFDVESIVFTALALVAGDYYRLFTGTRSVNPPHVFGDDVIIDDRVAETYVSFCDMLGFTVNAEKSFMHTQTDGYYRESCGVEYYNGIDISSRYYPRHPISSNPESIASLVSLEKRVYSEFKCNMFLRAVILKLEPRMTSHAVGTDCADMWTEEPIYKEYNDGSHGHLSLITKDKGKFEDTGTPEERRMLEHYYYYSYLAFGPRYLSSLDRLLGVSEPRRNVADLRSGNEVWQLVREF